MTQIMYFVILHVVICKQVNETKKGVIVLSLKIMKVAKVPYPSSSAHNKPVSNVLERYLGRASVLSTNAKCLWKDHKIVLPMCFWNRFFAE